MKTKKHLNSTGSSLKKPTIFLIILIGFILTAGFIARMIQNQDYPVNAEVMDLEIRLAAALEPVQDSPPELEEWMISFDNSQVPDITD